MTITTSFLGMCLGNNRILLDTKLTEDDFIEPAEQQAFSAMKKIMLSGGDVDLISLKNEGADMRLLAGLDSQITSGWRAREKSVIELTRKRNILRIAEKIQSSQALPAKDLEDMLSHELANLDRRGDYEPRFVYEVGEEEMLRIEERKKDKSKMIGFTTGIKLLDYLTYGFRKRKLYYIGGRPSQGKTSLLVNFAYNCNKRFGFLSAESGKEEILDKLFSGHGNVDSRKLTVGNVDNAVFTTMINYIDRETNIKSIIYDKPNMDIEDLAFMARNMVENYGCEILFVDYIQIITPAFSMRKADKNQQIADISMRLKQIARDLDIPVVVASQLRRDSETDRPTLSSFSDSSQIEKDADVGILIWKTKEKSGEVEYDKTYLLLEKNRDGETGKVEVFFKKDTQTFQNVDIIHKQEPKVNDDTMIF